MTAGSIIAGGFGLVRRHPGAVAVWGLIYLAVTVGMGLAMRPMLGKLALMSQAGAGNPAAAASVSSAMSGVMLLELILLAVATSLFAAAQRAVLRPEEAGFAYLRLGMDELRLFGLAFGLLILFYIALIVAMLVIVLVAALAAVVGGAGAAVALAVVGILALFGAMIWVQVRLSLAFPLTVMRKKIVVGEAWQATRGRFWTLFAAFLVIFLLLLVLWIAAALVMNGEYFADLAAGGFSPENIRRAGERQMARQFGTPTGTMALGWLLSAAAGSLSIAIFGGAVATGARAAVADVDGLAETFL
jgi:hypothetical protein